jgi:hypothetical protein
MLSDTRWKRLLDEAREFEHEVNGVRFRLRIPTRAELRGIVIEHGGMSDDASRVRALAAIVLAALVSAAGVRASHLGIGGDDELPATADVARAYVQENLEALDELSNVLNERMAKRTEALEADQKK